MTVLINWSQNNFTIDIKAPKVNLHTYRGVIGNEKNAVLLHYDFKYSCKNAENFRPYELVAVIA